MDRTLAKTDTDPLRKPLAGDCESWLIGSTLVQKALDHPRFGLLVFDKDLQVLHITETLRTVLQIPCDMPFQGSSLQNFLTASSLLERQTIADLLRKCSQNVSAVFGSQDGSRLFSMEVRSIGEAHWLASFEDITTQRQSEAGIMKLALQDPLTGLGNRPYFEQSVAAALKREPKTSFLIFLIDLDRFKAVNDTLGHAIGDETLRLVSQRLASLLRQSDTVARLGGDEFAVLLDPAPDQQETANLAGRIVDLLQRTYLVGGNVVNIGASIGIAVAHQDGATYEVLFKNADLALYHSKASGRGTFHYFHKSMEQRAQERRALELDLRKAIPMRQLELHYRPQIDTETNSVIGFEIALFWKHPKRGLLPSSEFLPLAEELGLVASIGEWVVRTACRDAKQWPEHIVISLSASRLQFETGRFAESVQRALTGSSLPGNRLEIGITENVLFRNETTVLATLHDLRALGVRIAMDNFGTGYASLSQLASFPFDRIKIDRSLLAEGRDCAKHRAMVRAITALGESLGVSTMAEGVQTTEQLTRLHGEGCGNIQGYFFQKAFRASELEAFLGKEKTL